MNKSRNNMYKSFGDIAHPIVRALRHLFKPAANSPASSKMTSDILIIGVSDPEKLAHGHCPHCKARVYLWLTGEGVEMSTSSRAGNL